MRWKQDEEEIPVMIVLLSFGQSIGGRIVSVNHSIQTSVSTNVQGTRI
jgi:hypothetical protein